MTLTNVDYKTFTKLLAVRLQGVIKSIIHENQSVFRNIAAHVRRLGDIMRFANNE